MRRWGLGRAAALGGAAVLALVATACEPAPTASWRSELVSLNGAGTGGPNRLSSGGTLSPDGTKVLFSTAATDMGFSDPVADTLPDLYMRDLVSGETQRITEAPDGSAGGNGATSGAVFTPDGATVVFASTASNLGPLDTNGVSDLYATDLATGTTRLLTPGASGQGANGASQSPVASPAGDLVAFRSAAADLGQPDVNSADDVYVLSLSTGTIELVSATLTGGAAGGMPPLDTATFGGGGRYLTFLSAAAGIVSSAPAGTNSYVRDLTTGTTALVSTGTGGAALPAGDGATRAVIDPTGARVAFVYRTRWGAVIRDQIYLRELATGTTTLVSRTGQTPGDGSSVGPTFAPAGDRLAFTSSATNLAAGDTNGRTDVFSYEVETDALALESYDRTGVPSNSVSQSPRFSPDGRSLAFVSAGANIVPDSPAISSELYLRDVETGHVQLVSVVPTGTTGGNFVSSVAGFTPDGRGITLQASSSTLDGRPVVPGVPSIFFARLTPFPNADLAITSAVPARYVPPGGLWSIGVTATNQGPEAVDGVTVTQIVPVGVDGVSATATASGLPATCSVAPAPSGVQQVAFCTVTSLAAGESVEILVDGTVGAVEIGSSLTGVSGVSATRVVDPDRANNTVVSSTGVVAPGPDTTTTTSLP